VRRAILFVALFTSACASSEQPSRPEAVTGTIDLPEESAGPPDAGTVAGHGNDARIGSTSTAVFTFTGRISPPDSSVRVNHGVIRTEPSGRFTVAVRSPAHGARELEIVASSPPSRPWRARVRIVRGPRTDVRVPERDVRAPTAGVLLAPAGETPPLVQASPSRANDRAIVATLPRPRFRATATVRDAEGGTGRIRLAMTSTLVCGGEQRRMVRLLPPAQVVRIALPPGAEAPAERERSARFALDVPSGCAVRGEVFAEGTDAHGLQAVTRHIGFRYP